MYISISIVPPSAIWYFNIMMCVCVIYIHTHIYTCSVLAIHAVPPEENPLKGIGWKICLMKEINKDTMRVFMAFIERDSVAVFHLFQSAVTIMACTEMACHL